MEDWQKIHIEKNLVELVKATICSSYLSTRFVASGVLSNADVESLELLHLTPFEKSRRLYDILKTRAGAYEILLASLRETGQTGAVQILENHNPIFRAVGRISYDKNCVLGRGNCGTKVFKGTYGNRDVAVKVVHTNLLEDPEATLREIEVMEKMDYQENVMRYFGAVSKHNILLIALELGVINLEDEIKLNLIQMKPIDILKGCTKGLAHLHRNKIIHGDLKPANILFTVNKLVKISGFGLSKQILAGGSGITLRSGVIAGTADWSAPETMQLLIEGTETVQCIRVSTSADIFSLGCIYVFTLTKGSHPFGDPRLRQYNIQENLPQLEALMIENHWIELVKKMISHQPSTRPSADEVLTSNCFKLSAPTVRGQASTTTSCEKSAEITTYQTGLISFPAARERHYIIVTLREHFYLHNFGMFPKEVGINIGVQLVVLCATYPIYFVRTIMQSRFDPYGTRINLAKSAYLNLATFKDTSALDNIIMMTHSNNRSVFYHGLAARIAQQITFTFMSNQYAWILRELLEEDEEQALNHLLSNLVNILCAVGATLYSHPFHVLAVTAVNTIKLHTSSGETVLNIAAEIYKSEGILGFFTGLFPRILGTILYMIAFDVTHKSLVSILKRYRLSTKYPTVVKVLISVFANVVARSVAYPINSTATACSLSRNHSSAKEILEKYSEYFDLTGDSNRLQEDKSGFSYYFWDRAERKIMGKGAIATPLLPFILL